MMGNFAMCNSCKLLLQGSKIWICYVKLCAVIKLYNSILCMKYNEILQ